MTKDDSEAEDSPKGRVSIDFSCGPGAAGRKSPIIRAAVAPFEARGIAELSDGVVSHCEGEIEAIADSLRDSLLQAFRAGATHFRAVVYARPLDEDACRSYIDSMTPVLASLNSEIVPINELRPSDVPLEWNGRLVAGVRELAAAPETVDVVDDQLRKARSIFGPLENLRRNERLKVLAWFRDQNVFQQRRAIDRIGVQMQVSRATIYNDMKALDRDDSDVSASGF
ncbi:helix-turn-helix domain-containing protein [Rhizobium sp. KVB221]|uniref:Helix-turn-helix domain-containing protein n=1 Tax=Rhizobium setariae TaxID=2801340 RepID=A0A936YTB4_9HYPH|nr:helix-turn-helix domain-containing protein [Rhizobium setariae]MBL0375468.1 helix-turn-helix domain-containing protein [Rhizobium setariae]